MRIGIIAADDAELSPFLQRMEYSPCCSMAMIRFLKANIPGMEIILTVSGVGKVNAAIAAEAMISRFSPDAVISVGTAGGIDPSVGVMDTILSQRISYHDVPGDILTGSHPYIKDNCFGADTSLLKAAERFAVSSDYPVRSGMIVTGDTFIEGKQRNILSASIHPLAADMESAAIAHACFVNHIPFISIRTVTDTAEHDGLESFNENCSMASSRAMEITMGMLEIISAEKDKES